jgi:hypothetical protein
MESLNPAPAAVPSEVVDFQLHMTDAMGRKHEMELTIDNGIPGRVHMSGDNIKLLQLLRVVVAIVERSETALF